RRRPRRSGCAPPPWPPRGWAASIRRRSRPGQACGPQNPYSFLKPPGCAGTGVPDGRARLSLGRPCLHGRVHAIWDRPCPPQEKSGCRAPMTLLLHDTLTRAKRPFEPRDPSRVTLYVCGPTVYDSAHFGTARPPVVFDVLFRLLRRTYGPDAVVYARNVTDVDDKINARAIREGAPIGEITARYEAAYLEDMARLNVLPPTLAPHVTDHIEAITGQIAALVERGAAYAAEGHVLFDVAAYPAYGALSGRALEDMIAGARVEVAPYKKNPHDFV